MKLHRLVLTNYRGITHREIEFPDHGVVVVCGANEIGKSSMIEALDLLLESKDRSTKKEVKQVKPTHADVGAEIIAEISTGPYRFVYRKRFHKRAETALTVLAPRREQLTGDEAHERVRAILDETVDVALWQAQRVLQSTSTAAVDLSGCDALSRALDVAAGEAVQLSGAEPLLIDRIDAEYLRYFTPTGRPTGEWATANKRMRDADDEVARCAAAVAEVDDAVRTHTAVTAELERLSGERADAATRLATARTAAEEVAALTQQLKQAEVVAAAAGATLDASVSALTERRRLQADVTERTATVAELEKAAAQAHEDELTAAEVQEAAEAAAEEARAAVQTSQARVEAARRAVDQQTDRDEAQRLTEPVDQDRRGSRRGRLRGARTRADCAHRCADEGDRHGRCRRRACRRAGRVGIRPHRGRRGLRHRVSGRRGISHAGSRRCMVGKCDHDHRHRATGRADRAGGAGCASFRYAGETRCRTTGSRAGTGGGQSRRRRCGAHPRSAAPGARRYPRQVDGDGQRA